jgi:hypothetical protein
MPVSRVCFLLLAYHVRVRIAVPRFDPTVGDVAGNARLIVAAAESAVAASADVLLLPELAICGYPPRDLLFREGFVASCERELDRLARSWWVRPLAARFCTTRLLAFGTVAVL